MPHIWTPDEVQRLGQQQIGHGLKAATTFYLRLIKNFVSEPGPYRKTFSRTGKVRYHRLVPATPGAPLQMMSSDFMQTLGMDFDDARNVGRVGTDKPYAAHWEQHGHPNFVPCLVKNAAEIAAVCGQAMTATVHARG